jgi:LmbE family N-acetylglucosaminyl deacetylase
MEMTGSKFEMWDYRDGLKGMRFNYQLILDLQKSIQETSWDRIVTHGKRGEYGHPQHKQIHSIVKKIAPNSWGFNLFGGKLSEATWDAKLKLIEVYKSQKKICQRLIPLTKRERIVRIS